MGRMKLRNSNICVVHWVWAKWFPVSFAGNIFTSSFDALLEWHYRCSDNQLSCCDRSKLVFIVSSSFYCAWNHFQQRSIPNQEVKFQQMMDLQLVMAKTEAWQSFQDYVPLFEPCLCSKSESVNNIIIKAQSVTAENCFEEVQFFGTILWRELKSYQKIALLTERKKEQARLHARFLALALCSHQCVCSLRS